MWCALLSCIPYSHTYLLWMEPPHAYCYACVNSWDVLAVPATTPHTCLYLYYKPPFHSVISSHTTLPLFCKLSISSLPIYPLAFGHLPTRNCLLRATVRGMTIHSGPWCPSVFRLCPGRGTCRCSAMPDYPYWAVELATHAWAGGDLERCHYRFRERTGVYTAAPASTTTCVRRHHRQCHRRGRSPAHHTRAAHTAFCCCTCHARTTALPRTHRTHAHTTPLPVPLHTLPHPYPPPPQHALPPLPARTRGIPHAHTPTPPGLFEPWWYLLPCYYLFHHPSACMPWNHEDSAPVIE